jgi:hypothetical protein
MNQKLMLFWYCTVSIILVLVGITFSFFGLQILPVNRAVLLSWESAIYGAIMIGWGATLFLLGRIAFRRQDAELMKAMLCGLFVWLVVEAVFSLYLGVFFNVGVDVAVLALFSIPLIIGIRRIKKTTADNESPTPQSLISG